MTTTNKNGPEYFEQLVKENERALSHLSNIRLKYLEYCREPWKAKSGKITKEYDSCVFAIKQMAKNYYDLCKHNDSYEEDLLDERIKYAEKEGIAPVLSLESLIEGIVSQTQEQSILTGLYEKVEKLNIPSDEIRGSNHFGDILTLHDCIRAMHQRAVQKLFTMDSGSGFSIQEESFENCANLKIINIETETSQSTDVQSLPILAFFEITKQLEKTSEGSYSAKIIADKNYALAQIHLGCHYAKLETKIDNDDSFISVRYADTNYKYAQERLQYLKLILNKLGYNTEINGKNLKADLIPKSKKQVYGALKETIRLLASSKDLDMNLGNRNYSAAYHFLKGKTNIDGTLGYFNPLKRLKEIFTRQDKKKFVEEYKYSWDNIEL